MTAPAGDRRAGLPQLHTPDAIATALGVSGWWVREQARQRRIPFTKVGGAYRFTDQHLSDIIRIFEHQPDPGGTPAMGTTAGRRRTPPSDSGPHVQLRARKPQRPRTARGGRDG
ncbi:MAG TPA: hypothetical protein VGX25_13420 [Actinophytocola sp.]|uniref:hypothetical protein n=1 Tax=Actinophytocola sp. TaxID=1872138 RepID=UPI002DDD8191|nr:hypothetical protein [Actinophytocola sp.]HEV2780383.1 hypothetical protein [Actinophytocola sp.]